jgi:hypothetical protein
MLGTLAGPSSASPLVQLPSPLGCVNPGGTGGCGDSGPLTGARTITFGPEGTTAYVTQPTGNSIVVFDVDPSTGALTRRGGAITGNGLKTVVDVAISANGEWLVAGSSGTPHAADDTFTPDAGVSLFQRDPATGALTARGCVTEGGGACADGHGLGAVGAVAMDATGTDVYASSWIGGASNRGFVAALRRSGDSLSQSGTAAGCLGSDAQDGCQTGRALHGPTAIAVAPDGEHVYAATWIDESVAMFDRVPATGTISQPPDTSGCAIAAPDAVALTCTPVDFLDNPGDPAGFDSEPAGLAFADNTRLYVVERRGRTIGVLDRDPGSGGLSRHAGTGGCVTSQSALAAVCTAARTVTAAGGAAGAGSLYATQGVAVRGGTLVAGTLFNTAVTSYDRAADGSLAPIAGPLGCIRPPTIVDCAVGIGFGSDAPIDLAFSPDGHFVYAGLMDPFNFATNGAILVFRHDTAPPACADRSMSTPANTVVRVALQCADADGDAMTLSIASGPANGVVGAIDAAAQTVDFAPSPGFVGQTSFTYKAAALGRESAPATVTVDVQTPPPVGGGGGGGPAAPERITSPVRPFWVEYRRYVVLQRLRIVQVPTGGAVEVRCKGRGCPFSRKRFAVKNGRVDASKAVRKGKLRVRARVQVRITKPGAIGKVVVYRVPKKGLPKGRVRCLPPGATKPTAC